MLSYTPSAACEAQAVRPPRSHPTPPLIKIPLYPNHYRIHCRPLNHLKQLGLSTRDRTTAIQSLTDLSISRDRPSRPLQSAIAKSPVNVTLLADPTLKAIAYILTIDDENAIAQKTYQSHVQVWPQGYPNESESPCDRREKKCCVAIAPVESLGDGSSAIALS